MENLHIFFLPFLAQGHAIPMVDMAKLLSSRGVKTTIISTPAFAKPVEKARESGSNIGLITIKFPHEESGLPDHIVSLDQVTPEFAPNFGKALALLQEPVEKLIQELNATCIVSDMFFPWTVDSAAKFGIPRLALYATSYFALCASVEMRSIEKDLLLSDSESLVVLSNLPNQPTFSGAQVAQFQLPEINDDDGDENNPAKLMEKVLEAEQRSYGVVVNSFFELEPEYADYYPRVLGVKTWSLGPLLLCNEGAKEKAQRGKESVIDAQECLAWLDSKEPDSVVYVCFGSLAMFTSPQLREIAIGLESSGRDFVWVVRKSVNGEREKTEEWMPEGFEERVKDRGLIIRGWAPQVVILEHPAVGAFVTHCGWNSTLEGISVGVPMVTWPLFAEQCLNEKLVTDVLRTGISVGNKKWQQEANEGIAAEVVSETVRRVMVGEEALEMRSRAKYYKEMGRKAVEEGGSSYVSLSDLIHELINYKKKDNEIDV